MKGRAQLYSLIEKTLSSSTRKVEVDTLLNRPQGSRVSIHPYLRRCAVLALLELTVGFRIGIGKICWITQTTWSYVYIAMPAWVAFKQKGSC